MSSEDLPMPPRHDDPSDPYVIALHEIRNGQMEEGLWARALSETEGDEARTRAHYIKMRVSELEGRDRPDIAASAAPADAAKVQPEPPESPRALLARLFQTGDSEKLKGVGGWLLLLVAIMLVVSPLVNVIWTHMGFWAAEESMPLLERLPAWQKFKMLTWIVVLTCAGIYVYGGWGLAFKRRWTAVKQAKAVLWVSGPGAALLLSWLIPVATIGESLDMGRRLIFAVISAGAWTAYLSKSRRVKNTYAEVDTAQASRTD